MAYALIPIYTQEVTASTVGNIAFNNIPQTYTDLMIEISLRGQWTGGQDSLGMYFNGVQSSRSAKHLYGNGSSSYSNTSTYRDIGSIPTAQGTANTFSNIKVYIPNYSGSAYKCFYSDYSAENNATAATIGMLAGLWSSNAAITSVAFDTGTSGLPFLQYSSISIYGIKAA
jgi:hypothetical protein